MNNIVEEYKQWKQSLESIQKAYLLGIVDEDVIEKAWKKHPIGTVITRKDGQKYKKVAETGNSGQDWKLVSKDKTKVDEAGEAKEREHKPEELKEQAKQTSETALQNAIKQSDDPKIRQAAHEELDRREKEEKPQEQKETKNEDSSNVKEGEKKEPETKGEIEAEIKRLRDIDTDDLDEITKISDQVQQLLKKREEVLDQKQSERKVSFEEYKKSFRDLSQQTSKEVSEFYKTESESLISSKSERSSIDEYVGFGYNNIREYLNNPNEYSEVGEEDEDGVTESKLSIEDIKDHINNISSFVSKNRISDNLSLNRRVKGDGSKFFRSLKKGDIYEDKSFSSTSLKELSHFGDFNIEILAKKGSSVANIDNHGELEYLIDKGSKFRVLDIQKDGIIVELL